MDERCWYLYTAEGQQGPYLASELQSYLAAGQITPEWYAWKEGFPDWRCIGDIPVLQQPAKPEGPPAAAEPATEPVGDANIYYNVILTDPVTFNLNTVTTAICKALKVPKQDWLGKVKERWGNVCRTNNADEAKKIQQGLAAVGIPARMVPSAEIKPQPQLAPTRKAVPAEAGLTFECGERLETIPWDAIKLICLGQVHESSTGKSASIAKQQQRNDDVQARTMQAAGSTGLAAGVAGAAVAAMRQKNVAVTKTSTALYLDILAAPPAPSIRILGDSFDYSFLGEEKEMKAILNMKKLVERIAAYVPHATKNQPARAITEVVAPGAITKAIKFSGTASFENQKSWLWQLSLPPS